MAALLFVAFAQAALSQRPETLASLLVKFDGEHDPAAKERLLGEVTDLGLTLQGSETSLALLRLAQTTPNPDTRWMAMRGMATIHCSECAPFLRASLKDPNAGVRANAARALGDLRITVASGDVLAMFAAEQDPGAIEQASLALRLLKITQAAPSIREKIPEYAGQTREWLIQALGTLGERADVPLIASYLDGRESDKAAEAIGELAGVDFGSWHPGLSSVPSTRTLAARAWWKSHRDAWPSCDDCRVK